MVRSSDFQSENTGSIPVKSTNNLNKKQLHSIFKTDKVCIIKLTHH